MSCRRGMSNHSVGIEHSEKRFISESLATAKRYRTTQSRRLLVHNSRLTQAAELLGLLSPIPQDQPYLVNQGANVDSLRPDVDARLSRVLVQRTRYTVPTSRATTFDRRRSHIRKEDFLDAPLWLPERDEQRAIAQILGTLDERSS